MAGAAGLIDWALLGNPPLPAIDAADGVDAEAAAAVVVVPPAMQAVERAIRGGDVAEVAHCAEVAVAAATTTSSSNNNNDSNRPPAP